MNIGIDKIGFYSPNYYLDMVDLAKARNVDPNKYIIGLGQEKMAVTPITQDTITMAANAATMIVSEDDKPLIDMVLFGTESGIDFSKSGATIVHQMLGINPFARCIEMKQACYAATAGLQMAKDYVACHPGRKVLVIASDISRYGINNGGEPTQGSGAVAMLISENPSILAIEDEATFYTDNSYDFWRPHYSQYALVDGKFSNQEYQRLFKTTYEAHLERYNLSLEDFNALVFHIPYSKMGYKALKLIVDETTHPSLFKHFYDSTIYNKLVGNIYTGSLFLSLLSLLVKGNLEPGARVGLYSYGSGAVGEFFSGILQEGYKQHLVDSQEALNSRTRVSVKEYENMFMSLPNQEGMHQIFDTTSEPSEFYLKEIKNHIRVYNK